MRILADTFVLYVKTKNFHWHVSGPHFRDYHLMFDEQADQILATVDDLAERVRKIGGTTLHSLAHIAKLTTLAENNAEFVEPQDMIVELIHATISTSSPVCARATKVAEESDDIATASLLENIGRRGGTAAVVLV